MKKKIIITCTVVLVFLLVNSASTKAQLSLSAQLRTRTELRNGQASPLPKGTDLAFFTSQRTRLSFGYNMYRVKLFATLQDVRVWGQDVSTINRFTSADNNALMLHEAWAEILLSDTAIKNKTFSVKLGRQELLYDDSRLLGNLDWAQQARRHDAAVIKYENKSYMVHAGFAFNQNKENAATTLYNSTPPASYTSSTNGTPMYKSMQFLYAGKKLAKGNASFLLLADQFSKYTMAGTTKTFVTGIWGRVTTGVYYNNTFKKLNTTAAAYYQFGKNASGQQIKAALLSGSLMYATTKKFSIGAGVDYTTGGSNANTSNAFDPLYGTPHKFWGLMDYYYVSSSFGNKGLIDVYAKARYKASDKFMLAADVHHFTSASNVYAADNITMLSKNFGSEIDLVGNYTFTKTIGFEAGYSHYFVTSSLTSPTVKNVVNAKPGADWVYLMINIKPEFLFK